MPPRMTGLPELTGGGISPLPASRSCWPTCSRSTSITVPPNRPPRTRRRWCGNASWLRCGPNRWLKGGHDQTLLNYPQIEASVKSPNTRMYHYHKVRTVIAFGLSAGSMPRRFGPPWTGPRCFGLRPVRRRPSRNPLPVKTFMPSWNPPILGLTTPRRGWLLVGLNFAMHLGEVCGLKWEEINLNRGTYVSIRAKTEEHRIPRAATPRPRP